VAQAEQPPGRDPRICRRGGRHPLDKAGALYNLAQAYFAAQLLDKAEQNVLAALEAAPGYRPAQRLLLQIEDATPRRPR